MNIVHLAIVALVGTSSLSLAACERREGGLERAGEKLDGEGEDVGEKLDEAGEDLKDAGEEATEK